MIIAQHTVGMSKVEIPTPHPTHIFLHLDSFPRQSWDISCRAESRNGPVKITRVQAGQPAHLLLEKRMCPSAGTLWVSSCLCTETPVSSGSSPLRLHSLFCLYTVWLPSHPWARLVMGGTLCKYEGDSKEQTQGLSSGSGGSGANSNRLITIALTNIQHWVMQREHTQEPPCWWLKNMAWGRADWSWLVRNSVDMIFNQIWNAGRTAGDIHSAVGPQDGQYSDSKYFKVIRSTWCISNQNTF